MRSLSACQGKVWALTLVSSSHLVPAPVREDRAGLVSASFFLARFPVLPLVSIYLSGQHLHSLQYWVPTKKQHKVTFDLGTFYDMYVIDRNSDFSLALQRIR